MKNRILMILCVLIFVSSVIFSGCSTGETQSPAVEKESEVQEPPEEEGEPISETEPAAQAEATFTEVPRNRTAIFESVMGRNETPENMNMYLIGYWPFFGLYQACFESLFYNNLETGEMIPWLASGYEFNEDFTEVTVNIREGVKWNDGVPFTADDLVFTINMLKDNETLKYSTDMNLWVEDVVASDDATAVITLAKPNPNFLLDYFGVKVWDTLIVLPKHIWEGKDPTTFTNYDLEKGWPVCTGPYKLVRSSEMEAIWDLRDDWWAVETGFANHPKPERLIWVVAGTEETRAAMVTANEMDAAFTLSAGTLQTMQAKNPNVITWTPDLPYGYRDPCPRLLYLNDALYPLNDSNVRWAVNFAINRDDLVQIAYEGATVPAKTLLPDYPPLQTFLDKNAELFNEYPVLEYNPEKSVEIMEGLGFTKDGDGFWVGEDGKRITLEFVVPAGEADKEKMMSLIVEQLQAVGFDANARTLEWAVFIDQLSNGKVAGATHDLCGSVSDPYTTFSLFHSRWAAPIGEPSPGSQRSRYANPEFDKIVDEMATLAADSAEFQQLADEALAIWVKDLPVVPLVQMTMVTPFNSTYWTNWPTASNNYVPSIYHWWVGCNLILQKITPTQ